MYTPDRNINPPDTYTKEEPEEQKPQRCQCCYLPALELHVVGTRNKYLPESALVCSECLNDLHQ
jgi:hypothetical protein